MTTDPTEAAAEALPWMPFAGITRLTAARHALAASGLPQRVAELEARLADVREAMVGQHERAETIERQRDEAISLLGGVLDAAEAYARKTGAENTFNRVDAARAFLVRLAEEGT